MRPRRPGVIAAVLLLCASCSSSGNAGGSAGQSGLDGSSKGFDPCTAVEVDTLNAALGSTLELGQVTGHVKFGDVDSKTCQWVASDSDIDRVDISSYIGPRRGAAELYKQFCGSTAGADGLPAGSFVCTIEEKKSLYVTATNPFSVDVSNNDRYDVGLELKVATAILAAQ